MIRVVLPHHLRTLAGVEGDVSLDAQERPTQRTVLDALEASYPVLRGTIRDHGTAKRRDFIRFFACGRDITLDSAADLGPALATALADDRPVVIDVPLALSIPWR